MKYVFEKPQQATHTIGSFSMIMPQFFCGFCFVARDISHGLRSWVKRG